MSVAFVWLINNKMINVFLVFRLEQFRMISFHFLFPLTENSSEMFCYIYLKKLDALEKEEELREQAGYYNNEESEEDEEMQEIRATASK